MLFDRMCPIYMSYGMSYDEFWEHDVFKCEMYRKAHVIGAKNIDEQMWLQGMYIYEALCKVSPVLHAFSKKGAKPLPYSTKPYMQQEDEKKQVENKQKIENERLIAQIHFQNWARATKKHFESKK